MNVLHSNLPSFQREFKKISNLKQKDSVQIATKNVNTLKNLPTQLSAYGILLNRYQNVSFKGWDDDGSQSPKSEEVDELISNTALENAATAGGLAQIPGTIYCY